MSSQADLNPFEKKPTENGELVPSDAKSVGSAGSTTVEWGTLAPGEQAAAKSINPAVYLHAIRRHWLLSVVLGVIFGGMVGVSVYLLLPRYYTASSLVKVSMMEDSLVSGGKISGAGTASFDIYKNTQLQTVRSPFVLQAAMRGSEITPLAIVKAKKDILIPWLRDELKVWFPGDSELMEISLTGKNPDEVTKMVQAITNAYKAEAVDKEVVGKRKRLGDLRRIYAEQDEEVRKKRASMNVLAETLKTSDKRAVSIQQQTAVQRLGESRRQSLQVQSELRKLKGELLANQEAYKRFEEADVNSFEIHQAIQRDPVMQDLMRQESGFRSMIAQQDRVARPGSTSLAANRFARQASSVTKEREERENEIREMIKSAKRGELAEVIAHLQVKVTVLEKEKEILSKDVANQRDEVATIGKSSVEFEMMQSSLKSKEQLLARLNEQKETFRIELQSESRIQVLQQATKPKTYDSPKIRIAISCLSAGIGFVMPIFGLIWWDVRKRRINTADEVAQDLGLRVLGSVPIIPGRTIERLNGPSRKSQQWSLRLAESIDGISARLLRSARLNKSKVVLISSAVSGEGKTTLATQLAMSLARTGKRTALVDFDLRRPSIDKAFGLPLDPGVSEVLCCEVPVDEIIQSVDFPNLSVVTAGRCDRVALQALANGGDEMILQALRDEFDFVIVDGSPILPVADSRYVAQHVDTVVMSVFRDYSRAPRVSNACEILNAFGVEDIEAVVISSTEEGYGTIEPDSEA
jgi:polysaccharide biosynthesis transport protein